MLKISPAVSAGIIELIRQNKISATGCMMTSSYIKEAFEALRSLKEKIDLGIHLVLTGDKPMTHLDMGTGLVQENGNFIPFPTLAKRCYLRINKVEFLEQELRAQIELFKQLSGVFPNFIDGHQHIQQLPQVSDVIIKLMHEYNLVDKTYVRVSGLPPSISLVHKELGWKTLLGNKALLFPQRKFKKKLERKNILHNRHLLGYYPYEGGLDFKKVFESYMMLGPSDRDIFFCHPGYVDEELKSKDDLVLSRLDVLNYLASKEYDEFSKDRQIRANRFFLLNHAE